jgi:hypothetical protein
LPSAWKGLRLFSDGYIPCSFQAVPYSRDYKQKYDYFRSKLRKPVSITINALNRERGLISGAK